MTEPGPRPLSLSMCLVHHPGSHRATSLRSLVYKHYRRDPHKNLGEGGLGLEVEYRDVPANPSPVPILVDFARAQVTAIVAIFDEDLAGDATFADYALGLAASAAPLFPKATFLAVATDDKGMRLAQSGTSGAWQTLDARAWPEDQFTRRLFTAIDDHFCRLLMAYLESIKAPGADATRLRRAFAKRAQVFLSHSKHDADKRGEKMALALRDALAAMSAETFFDAVDLPAGTPWEQAIDDAAGGHALVAILTDSYSSRTFCKKEVLSAKRAGVPIVVANCLEDYEARGFPYAGNAPVVQMVPDPDSRQHQLIGRLFDELLRNLIWKCHIAGVALERGVKFQSRAPELVTLAYIELDRSEDGGPSRTTIVYPGAPVGEEEEELFRVVAPHVKLSPFVAWRAGLTT